LLTIEAPNCPYNLGVHLCARGNALDEAHFLLFVSVAYSAQDGAHDSCLCPLRVGVDGYFDTHSDLAEEGDRVKEFALHGPLPRDVWRDALGSIAPELAPSEDPDAHITYALLNREDDLVDVFALQALEVCVDKGDYRGICGCGTGGHCTPFSGVKWQFDDTDTLVLASDSSRTVLACVADDNDFGRQARLDDRTQDDADALLLVIGRDDHGNLGFVHALGMEYGCFGRLPSELGALASASRRQYKSNYIMVKGVRTS
jgi:hypothetical protein